MGCTHRFTDTTALNDMVKSAEPPAAPDGNIVSAGQQKQLPGT